MDVVNQDMKVQRKGLDDPLRQQQRRRRRSEEVEKLEQIDAWCWNSECLVNDSSWNLSDFYALTKGGEKKLPNMEE